ncbi:acetyl-/propionyl-CoA carboxylase subunit alpha [Bowdeniella nasicola]|uniref:biotin carboxylase n=1 Tax=Bowdeniella nasicola TaxID=208480 RepID=A0A1Q5Q2E7_9ACTO|nr:biotin carboxylase N-terminal domain-containing protein [Bowdeniella nasicola]OKL54023.1 acetyl-/propionyl-CoA carboxylase subunit alpha [Bowdeniella nasicola]
MTVTARPIRRVLIANRGEIAVRIIRTCRELGIRTIAVYSDGDRAAMHVLMADEAYALGGVTAPETYLDPELIISVAKKSGADAVHPGYGFLSERADFAQSVLDAGLIWIGPPPSAIESLGDKVSARHIAESVGAPLVPGTPDPVENADDVIAFAKEHGLPVAIKAAYGGGGRGLKVARTLEEIPELFDSAVREATAAFGRGECFVERFLDKPRHVETQCLADQYGTVAVLSTRDCSLQRRHQKLVEEAPAPFLSAEQNERLEAASKAILKAAGYVGAGTCEFLVGNDGTLSFLEVNTRLQVEHPVTEEITGLDLVAEQLRIAAGQDLGYDRVETRGHAIELRINGEDPTCGFMPAPGTITELLWPGGPGVRIDAGVKAGSVVSGNFDSMIAKIIVHGADREAALAKARRAVAEAVVEGIPTVLPFHNAVLHAPDYTAEHGEFKVYTTWIETEFAETLAGLPGVIAEAPSEDETETERVVVEVGGKRLEVVLPAGLGISRTASGLQRGKRGSRRRRAAAPAAASGNSVSAPMQASVVRLAVANGDRVEAGDLIVVVEAMKMEQPLSAPKAGIVSGLTVSPGDQVSGGQVLATIDED